MFQGNNFNSSPTYMLILQIYVYIHPYLSHVSQSFLIIYPSVFLSPYSYCFVIISSFSYVSSSLNSQTLSLSLKIYSSLPSLKQEKCLHSVLLHVAAVFSFIHISCLTSKPYTCTSDFDLPVCLQCLTSFPWTSPPPLTQTPNSVYPDWNSLAFSLNYSCLFHLQLVLLVSYQLLQPEIWISSQIPPFVSPACSK